MVYIKKIVVNGFKSFAKKTDIIFDKGINLFVGPNGAGKCVTGESLVQLADGSLERIDNMVNSRLDGAVKTEDGYIIPSDGTEVICLSFDNLKMIKKPIRAFVKRISPDKLLKIKTRSGREIKATKYHPLFILKEGDVIPAKAEEIKIGEKIAIPRKLYFEPKHLCFTELLDLIKEEDNIYVPFCEDYNIILKGVKGYLGWKELAKKIGIPYYVIKGLLNKQAVRLSYLIKILRYVKLSDIEIVDLIKEIRVNGTNTKFLFRNSPEFSRFFGYLLAEGRLAESSHIWFTNGDREIVDDYVNLVKKLFNKNPLVRKYKPNCWDVIIYSEPLKIILSKLGMASKTENKEISNIILKHSSVNEIANLLNGLYCGDGYISNNYTTVEITTKSEKLAKGIVACLLRLGIVPREREVVKGIKSTGFYEKYKNIVFYGVDNIKIFNDNVNLIHKEKKRRILNGLNKKSNTNIDLIEVNSVVKNISKELKINIKNSRKETSILDAYCYNQCIPSRNGLALLEKTIFLSGESQKLEQLRKLINSDIFWDEIASIEEIKGEEWVYDLCVDNDHNFIANNILVHNSNVVEALCFVLGRLSAKSMRASKAKNLIFMGSRYIKPAKEAYVELIFDNSDRAFSINSDEVGLKRIVRVNGQSIYKINGETKTRGEIIEMLAQAGIDPYGFNLILQGQIQSIVKMHSEERRKIIEEVAGISIYESRKEKSLHELEKTDERLKEISTILRERTAYLRNLEREKMQAQKYRDTELIVKRAKASILSKRLGEKERELENIKKSIEEKEKIKFGIKKEIEGVQSLLNELSARIDDINKKIQKSSGIEQETLHNEISELKAELEGSKVRKESYENRQREIERRIEEISKSIPNIENEIKELRKKSPSMAKKAVELKKKKEELSSIESKLKKILGFKTELESLKERIKDKEKQLTKTRISSESLVKIIEENSANFKYGDEKTCLKAIEFLKKDFSEKKQNFELLRKGEIDNNKIMAAADSEIDNANKIKADIEKIDICPLCQSKITEKHIKHVYEDIDKKIKEAAVKKESAINEIKNVIGEKNKLESGMKEIEKRISEGEIELINQRNVEDKKEQLKDILNDEKTLKNEISELEKEKNKLGGLASNLADIEEKYGKKMLEIEDISILTEENLDTALLYKERELENMRNIIKKSREDLDEIRSDADDITNNIEEKSDRLEKLEEQERELQERFKKMFSSRDELQRQTQEKNLELGEKQQESWQIEDQMNYLKVGKAKLDAESESVKIELSEFAGIELLSGSINLLEERLKKSQEILLGIGSINMRALEVYEEVKKEYDIVQEKVDVLQKEKDDILRIVEEIDKKKTNSFMKTFKAINSLFSENFSKLSSKGVAYLDIENKDEIFNAGVNIVVKLGKGKYFDVTSLSGGEQTLVALSLLFAIQEHKPYHFYVFDEIDAALDRRNSERLAALLDQYMKSGQYIVITHNDAIVTNSNFLYGVSMHDGVSKILSLKIN